MKRKKSGGREKGTPNKITAEIRQILKNMVDSELSYISANIDSLSLESRVNLLTKLLPYTLPKIQPVIHTAGEKLSYEEMVFGFNFSGDVQPIKNENDIEL